MSIDHELQERARAVLQYPAPWFDTDFLDTALLEMQLSRFAEGSDPNTEHYRFYAFRRVLNERTLTDETIATLTRLTAADPHWMRESVLYDLIWYRHLPETQLEVIFANIPPDDATLLEVYHRLILRRRLAAEPPTEELLNDCLSHRGSDEHALRWLMERELSDEQWERIIQSLPSDHSLRSKALREYQYQSLIRRLLNEEMSRALFNDCLASADGRIQKTLTSHDLPLEYWELLASQGATVQVRHAAAKKIAHQQRVKKWRQS